MRAHIRARDAGLDTMNVDLIGWSESLSTKLAELPKSSPQKAYINVLLHESDALIQKMRALEEENGKLIGENIDLRSKLSRYLVSKDWIEARGMLLKKTAEGGVESHAYCKECRVVLSAASNVWPLACPK